MAEKFQVYAKDSPISHGCLIKFQFIYRNLKSAERRAADFCLKNPKVVSASTISEVAVQANCSEATLVRLAQHLGYSGYPDLRVNILRSDQEDVTHYINVRATDPISTITTNVFDLCTLYIRDSLEAVDQKALDAAATLILKAKRFMFVATGDAHFIAASGAQKFTRLGYQTVSTTDFDSQLLALSQMSEDDVMICISHSGRTKNTCEIVKIAHDMGVNVISITNFPVSPLSRSSDVVLLTASFAYDMMDEIIAKRIPALCLLDSLYIYLLVQRQAADPGLLDRSNAYLQLNKL